MSLGFCRLPDGTIGEIKSVNKNIVVYYVLDKNRKRIQDGYNVHGEPHYTIGISARAKILSIQLNMFD